MNTAPASKPLSEKPAGTTGTSAEAIVAKMSNEQARHLLIEELKKEAAAQLASELPKEDDGTFGEFIEKVRNKLAFIQERIEYIKSGGKSNHQEMKGVFAYLNKRDPGSLPTRLILYVLILFFAAYAVELVFRRYTAPLMGRVQTGTTIRLRGKFGRLLLRVVIDVIAILVFIAAVLIFRYLFFKPTYALRILLVGYLSAIVAVKIVLIIVRFFLAPKDPSLRFLPITDKIALFLYRWMISISIVTSFGFMTCGIINLAGVSEAAYIRARLIVDLIFATMLIFMIFQKRQEVADTLSANFPTGSQPAKLMKKWHHFSIFFIFLLLINSTGYLLLGISSEQLGLKILLMIPLYFFTDWILRQILEVLFGFIPNNEDTVGSEVSDDEGETEAADKPTEKLIPKHIEFGRIKKIIVSALRIALVALFTLWTLDIWGIELPVGKAVSRAVFDILIVVLLCYIIWEFLNAAIKRRLRMEMPDDDEDMEEGGAGGSRIGTLLMLLRKFLIVFILVIAVMVILSAMGVNIGPLIAGAGIFGLAIGFGSQTLVKDIIAGIFFLMDDAFRVGDFIQCGNGKGMVERISLRSISLRHPRGMVNTLPYGDISSVINFSRDYIITKLDFRVRYDTDVETVRKLIKKEVYQVILKDEKLRPKLLGKIKSQGVRQMDDSAMIMRVKYKTKPGEQFAIRKEVYRLLQEAFKQGGIEFAHKNVTVYIPPESSQSPGKENKDSHQKILEAAAAAASLEEQAPRKEDKAT
jgi:small-conductance mechanosensitive channel